MWSHVPTASFEVPRLGGAFRAPMMSSISDRLSGIYESIVSSYETFSVFLNREPWLTIRRVLWIVSAGWVLATTYVLAALGMVLSIVFIPFAPTALRFAWWAPLTTSISC